MAKKTPRGNFNYGWGVGESGWAPGTDENWVRLSAFAFHLSAINRTTVVPPVSPAEGDTYIIPSGATDDWVGLDDSVAVWNGSGWLIESPSVGWIAYIEDEEKLCAFKGAGWSAGISI